MPEPSEDIVTIEPRVTKQASRKARQAVKEHAGYCAAAALVPGAFIGSLAVSAMQLKMLADLSKIYEVPFTQSKAKAALAAGSGGLLNLILTSNPATQITRNFFMATMPWIAVPMRFLASPLIMAGYSYLLGQAFIRHYENGGDYINFDWWEFRADLCRRLGMPPLQRRPIDI